MIRNRFAAAMIPALLLPLVPAAWAVPLTGQQTQEANDSAEDAGDVQDQEVGESPERYAQVKVVEGSVTIHKGETDEILSRGVPVAEGDVVESHGRGVLQLGDGSALAFGADTQFRVAALFAEQDEVRRVLLVLDRGELRLHKGPRSDAILKVDTPSASVTLGNRGNGSTRPDATLQVASDMKGSTTTLLVHGGQVTCSNAATQTQVFAGERLTVYGREDALDRITEFNAYGLGDFDAWAEDLVKPHPSESASRVPQEIRYYADDLDHNGRWVYVDDCATWCWTPTVVDAEWQPYCNGRWAAYGAGMTWISSEPWGYVTYHHGRWGWGVGLGWYWIPGVFYSPAWVAWNCSDAYFGWAPLGYRNRPCRWGRDRSPCWNIVDVRYVHDRNLRTHFRRDPDTIRVFTRPANGSRPWFQGRMMVRPDEFRDPVRFRQVASERGVARERLAVYARNAQASTGRVVMRPSAVPADRGPSRGFDRLEHPIAPTGSRPVLRTPDQPRSSDPASRPQRSTLEGRTQVGPRPGDSAPTSPGNRLIQRPVPTERPQVIRPSVQENRPQATPGTRIIQRTDPGERPRTESRSEASPSRPTASSRQGTPSRQEAPSRSSAPSRQESRPEAAPRRSAPARVRK